MTRRRDQFEQNAVDPKPHLILVFKRLEVDVRSLVANRCEQHEIDQFPHRSGIGHFFDRFQVDRRLVAIGVLLKPLIGLNLPDHITDGFLLTNVKPFNG